MSVMIKCNEICQKEFNIAFCYSRVDTCSRCDKFHFNMNSLQKIKHNCTESSWKGEIENEVIQLRVRNKVHKRKHKHFALEKV